MDALVRAADLSVLHAHTNSTPRSAQPHIGANAAREQRSPPSVTFPAAEQPFTPSVVQRCANSPDENRPSRC
eukprot:2168855-Pleurochrysis_carterae.AAC.1